MVLTAAPEARKKSGSKSSSSNQPQVLDAAAVLLLQQQAEGDVTAVEVERRARRVPRGRVHQVDVLLGGVVAEEVAAGHEDFVGAVGRPGGVAEQLPEGDVLVPREQAGDDLLDRLVEPPRALLHLLEDERGHHELGLAGDPEPILRLGRRRAVLVSQACGAAPVQVGCLQAGGDPDGPGGDDAAQGGVEGVRGGGRASGRGRALLDAVVGRRARGLAHLLGDLLLAQGPDRRGGLDRRRQREAGGQGQPCAGEGVCGRGGGGEHGLPLGRGLLWSSVGPHPAVPHAPPPPRCQPVAGRTTPPRRRTCGAASELRVRRPARGRSRFGRTTSSRRTPRRGGRSGCGRS